MIVADTSLLVNFYLETEFTQFAENVFKLSILEKAF